MTKSIYQLLIVTALVFTSSTNSFAQTRAVTELGDTIYVYDNGTWAYELMETDPDLPTGLEFLEEVITLDTISSPLKFSTKAQKEIKDKAGIFTLKYEESKWKRIPPKTLNDEAEFAFENKLKDMWAIILVEETVLPTDKLFLIAKNTLKEAGADDPQVIKTELRTINGYEVLRAVISTNFSGIDLVFDNYYYSNEKGSVQFSTWTTESIWTKNEEMTVDFASGFIIR